MISKGVFRRSWYPRAKRRVTTPSPDPPAQTALPVDRQIRARQAAQWKFWRKRWRRPAKPKARAVIPTSIPVVPSTLNGGSFRHGLTFKRQVFRSKWYPRRSRPPVPFDPPAPPPAQDPTIIQLKPLRMRRVRNALWRKKWKPKPRKRYSVPDTPLLGGVHLELHRHPKAWFPRPRRRFTPPFGAQMQVVLGQAIWSWGGHGAVINGSTIVALAKAVWSWSGKGILAPTTVVLGRVFWNWNRTGLTVSHNEVIVTLGQAQWSWSGQGLTARYVWTPTGPSAGQWTPASAGTGTWTLHSPATGTWTKL